jgi:hypothetical protein
MPKLPSLLLGLYSCSKVYQESLLARFPVLSHILAPAIGTERVVVVRKSMGLAMKVGELLMSLKQRRGIGQKKGAWMKRRDGWSSAGMLGPWWYLSEWDEGGR